MPAPPHRLFVPSLRTLAAACVVAAVWGAGCKRKATVPTVPPLELASVEETRRDLLATVALPSFDGAVEEAAAIAKTLQLPFAEPELRGVLLARLGVPTELGEQLDTKKPIGVAVVARANQPSPFVAVAAEARGADAVAKIVAALGTRTGAQQDAVQVRRPDGTKVWLLARGAVVVASETIEGLVAAGAHALAARRPGREDLVVTLHPDAVARAQGTEVRPALDRLRDKLARDVREASAKRGKKPSPAEAASFDASVAPVLDRVADVASAEIVVDVDRARGVSLGVRAMPRPGSELARELGEWRAQAPDPAVAAGDAPAAFVSIGASRSLLELYPQYLEALARSGVKGAADLAKAERALANALTGRVSARVDVRPAGSSYDAAVELAPGVAGTDALEALGRVLAHPALPAVLDATVGRNAARVRWKRTGDVARAELTLAAGADPEARRALKSLAGAEAVVAQVTAARGQLLVATGVDAAARLQTLAGDRAAAPAAEVAALAAGAKEAAGFAYVDLLAFVRTGLAAASGTDAGAAQVSAMMGALPAFASLKLPVAVMWTGGERFSGDLRVPIETMTGAATAVRPFVGLGGLGGPPP